MPSPIVHNETTATNLGGFVTVLTNLTCRAFALEEPPGYVVFCLEFLYQVGASSANSYPGAGEHKGHFLGN